MNRRENALAYIAVLMTVPPFRWLLRAFIALYLWVQRAFFRQLFEARIERSRESARAWLAWAEENEPELYERASGRKARRPPQ